MLRKQVNREIEGVSLVLDGAGSPLVTWTEQVRTSDTVSASSIHAAAWDGIAWLPLEAKVSGSSTLDFSPSLVMGSDGRPMVAWSGFVSPSRSILVRRWTGSAWEDVGTPLSALSGINTAAFKPVLALDQNGQPMVAWHESDGSVSNVYVYRYNH